MREMSMKNHVYSVILKYRGIRNLTSTKKEGVRREGNKNNKQIIWLSKLNDINRCLLDGMLGKYRTIHSSNIE